MKIKALKNYQLITALLLIIFIPASLLLYNNFFISKFRTLMNNELINKAALSADMIIGGQAASLANPAIAQQIINRIAQEANKDQTTPSIQALSLLVPAKDGFKMVAGLNPTGIDQIVSDQYYQLAWENNFIAFNTASGSQTADQTLTATDQKNNARYTTVLKVLKDDQNNKIGLLSLKIPAREVDDYLSGIVSWSNLILVGIILIILISIVSNSQLFKYAFLFENLKETSKLKDEFISIGSHELRAPLTVIKGNTDLAKLALNKGDTAKANQFIDEIVSSTNRLNALVGDMLDVSRIEQGKMKFNLAIIEPIPVIKEIINQFTQPAKEKGLTLKFTEPDKELASLKIDVDLDRFKQILINLTSNAIKYTLQGGLMVNLALADNRNLAIKFKDTGVGMNAKQREKLFQKFYRVENTKTNSATGTGLGLWITKMITEAMKGEIMVDSIEDVGTEFTIIFPIAKE